MLHAETRIAWLIESAVKQRATEPDRDEILNLVESSTETAVASFSPLRSWLKSRSSTDAYHTLKLIKALILKSDNYLRLLPTTTGQPLLITILNIATQKKQLKKFKITTGKQTKTTEFFASQLILGLSLLYASTRYEAVFSRLQSEMTIKLPNFIPVESELIKFKNRNRDALSIIENISYTPSSSSNLTNNNDIFDPDSLTENIKLLTEFFVANRNLRGESLRNNEIVSIVLEKIKSDQKALISYIDIISDPAEKNRALVLNSNINELKDVFSLLVKDIEPVARMGFGTASKVADNLASKPSVPASQPNYLSSAPGSTAANSTSPTGNLASSGYGSSSVASEEVDIFQVLDNLKEGAEGMSKRASTDLGESVEQFSRMMEENEKELAGRKEDQSWDSNGNGGSGGNGKEESHDPFANLF